MAPRRSHPRATAACGHTAAPPLQLSAARSSSGGGRRLEDARQRAGYVRVFVILELVERLLATGKKATLRELYYAAASHPQFAGKSQVCVIESYSLVVRTPLSLPHRLSHPSSIGAAD